MISLVHVHIEESLRRAVAVKAMTVLLLTAIAAATMGLATPVLADGGIAVDVKPGFDGYARHEAWVPVTVTTTNSNAADFAGTVVLRLYEESSHHAAEWQREVAVPGGGSTPTVFYVPANMTMLQATVLDASGKRLEMKETRMQYRDGTMAAVIASNPDTLRVLSGMDLRPGQTQGGPPATVTVVRPTAHDMPTFSRALAALDIIALNDTSSEDLSSAQWAAIETWVGQGGTLVLGGGPGWRQTMAAVPEVLQPVAVTGTVTLPGLPALAAFAGEELPEQPVVVSDGTLRDARIIVEEAGVPLIVESRYGAGQVVYTAFDLALDPVAFWRGGVPLWRQLLGGTAVGPRGGGRPGVWTNDLQWVVRQFPHLAFPSTRVLVLALVGYLVVIGPVNYLVLKRLDRRDLMWVTIPVVVAIVGAGIWGISLRGSRDLLTNSLAVMHLAPGVERVPVSTTVGIYAPTQGRLQFSFDARQQIAPVMQWDNWGGQPGNAQVQASVSHGATNDISFGAGTNWAVRMFTVTEDVAMPGRIEGVLRPTPGGDIAGTIVNETPLDLEDVHVIVMNTFIQVGDLPAGATRDVSLTLQPSTNMYREDIAWQIYGPQPPSWDVTPEQSRRRDILQQAFQAYAEGIPHPVTVLGWTQQPLTNLAFGGAPDQHASLALVYGALEFTLPQDDFVLPAGLVGSRVYDHDMVDGWFSGGNVTFDQGWIAFALQLPEMPPGVALAELRVTAYRLGHSTGNVAYSLYNWQTGGWDAATVDADHIPVTNLDAYVYDGEVRLRAELVHSGYIELPFPSAIVTGKKVAE